MSLRRGAPDLAAALVVAALVALAAALLVYPGWHSFDSAQALKQAATGEYADLQPPAMALTWAGLLALGLPPGALVVLHLALAALGLALLGAGVAAGRADAPRRWPLVLPPLLLLYPPLLALFAHAWADVALAATLLLAAGALAWAGRTRAAALAAIALLGWAVFLRHNAAAAALPLLALAAWRAGLGARADAGRHWTGRWAWRAPWIARLASLAAALALALAALLGAGALGRALSAHHATPWAPTAIWDLAAVSVASDAFLLPAGMHGPGMDVDELRPITTPDTVIALLSGNRSGLNAGDAEPIPEPARGELRARWLGLPLTHTRDWLAHRGRVAWSLLGPQRRDKAPDLMITPRITTAPGAPPLGEPPGRTAQALAAWVFAHRDAWWLAPIAWLALGLPAVALALRRRFAGDRALVLALVASALAYTAPLLLLAPAAEWRYLLWPMLASALALLLALAGTRR